MKKSKLLLIMLFLVLAFLLVSCKTKDNLIKIIEHNQQASESSPKEAIKEDEKPLKKPSFIRSEPSLEELAQEVENKNYELEQIYLYLDLLDYSTVESEYGDYILFDDKINGIDSIALYDLNSDGIPELFVEGGYESTCIYSIKDSKVIFLEEIIPGDIDIRKDLDTNKETMFVTSHFDEAFYLSTVHMESGTIIYEILFGKYWRPDEQPLDECYLNLKDSMETLEEAFMDYEDRQVSKEVYEKAMKDFEDSHEIVETIILYDILIYNEEGFDEGVKVFTEVLDNYILNNN